MSKVGQKPIELSDKVKVFMVNSSVIEVNGPVGKISIKIPQGLEIKIDHDKIFVLKKENNKQLNAIHGTFRQILQNAVTGVEKPWQKILEIVGTGYNARLQGDDLVIKIGFSHPVIIKKPEGINFQVEGNNKIIISGINKEQVGQLAHKIRSIKPPDSYKGKGIRYEGEKLRLKPGKKAKGATG